MKNVFVILSHLGTRVSKAIRLFTGATYTHASICLDDSFRTFYSFARRNIRLPIFGGIVEEHPKEGILGMYSADCLIYKVTVTDEQYDAIKAEIEHMLANKNVYTYNFLGLLTLKLGIPFKRRHHFTCTQFVAYILEHNGVECLNSPYELAKPLDFLEIKGEHIYSGKVNDLI